jgi:hypothetical protein
MLLCEKKRPTVAQPIFGRNKCVNFFRGKKVAQKLPIEKTPNMPKVAQSGHPANESVFARQMVNPSFDALFSEGILVSSPFLLCQFNWVSYKQTNSEKLCILLSRLQSIEI